MPDLPPPSSTSSFFLSWLRRGVGGLVGSAHDASSPLRALVPVTLQIHQVTEGAGRGDTDHSVSVDLPMFGPEDVVSIDESVVARRWPQPDADDAESVFFPLVEFSEPDLPWRYSLAGGDPARVMPWLALIVLREDEFVYSPSGSAQSLATVLVKAGAMWPDPAQGWAWAHVDAEGSDPVRPEELPGGTAAGRRIVARLLAARRLQPRTRYGAFVVPVYARACEALRGGPVRSGVEFAWGTWPDGIPGEVTLPVYLQWRFGTGAEGTFETLARRLGPGSVSDLMPASGTAPSSVSGTRPVAIGSLPRGMRASAPKVDVGGALRPIRAPEARIVTVDAEAAGSWSLESLLTATTRVTTTPLVGPPFYGRWHAATTRFDVPWVRSVNLDLRYRMVAGAGGEVVQDQQQALMAGAWAQLEGIRLINELLRFSQVSREASARAYCRDFCSIPTDALLSLTAPVHTQVLCGGRSVASTLANSRLIPGSLDPQWRRLTRPRGPLARRQGRVGRALNPFGAMNEGKFPAAGPPSRPVSLTTARAVGVALAEGDQREVKGPKDAKKEGLCPDLPLLAQIILSLLGPLLDSPSGGQFDPTGEWRGLYRDAVEGKCGDLLSRLFELLRRPDLAQEMAQGPGGATAPALLDAFVKRLTVGAQRPVKDALASPRIDLSALDQCLRTSLNPRHTIPLGVTSRLGKGEGVLQNPADPLEPVLACPVFPQPMFKPLYDKSPSWLLPGLEHLPNNSVLPTQMNAPFVEAYMLGLNHEMARELFWNEYPTDRRGTAFAQFWPVTGAARSSRDILPIHQWGGTLLGTHRPNSSGMSGSPLVFVIRGDLLRRYPNVTYFAVQQQSGGFSSSVLRPTFEGFLPPDMAFVGFDLPLDAAEDVARGWRMVIQEPSGESCFQLPTDAPGSAELPPYSVGGPNHSFYVAVDHPAGSSGDGRPRTPGTATPTSSAEVARMLLHPKTWVVFDISALIRSAEGSS